jgi:cytosine deaminase
MQACGAAPFYLFSSIQIVRFTMDNLFQQSNAPCRRLVRGGLVAVGARDVRQADMLISEKGIILDIAPDIEPEGDMQLIDAAGCIASPGLVDMHQHLDKTGVLRFAPNPSGTLQGARDAFAKYARQAPPDDILKRASRTIERCLSRGTTAIRSHVNGIEALAKLRSDWAGRVKLQLVAFMIPHPGQDLDWLEANIDRAVALADAVGGTPAVAEDPERYLDILFAAAARHGRPVDLHLDEHLNPQRPLFNAVFERVRR